MGFRSGAFHAQSCPGLGGPHTPRKVRVQPFQLKGMTPENPALAESCSEKMFLVPCKQVFVCILVIYLCPFERFHRAVLYARRALPDVRGIMEEGAVLRCKLKRPVPNRGEP